MSFTPASLTDVVRNSMNVAQPLAQAYAEGNMEIEIEITRPAMRGFDRDAAAMTARAAFTVYAGKAGMGEETGGQVFNLGDEPQYYASSYVVIPLDAGRPQVNDDVKIVTHRDPELVDRHYRITAVSSGGRLPASRKCSLVGAEPAPNVTL